MGHADNGIHGRADLMTHVGQKIAFGPVGFISDLFGFEEFILHVLALGDIPQRLDSADCLARSII